MLDAPREQVYVERQEVMGHWGGDELSYSSQGMFLGSSILF